MPALYDYPVAQPKAIVLIVHGMMEHARPYRELANFLNLQGFGVVCYDQIAHGPLALKQGQLGHTSFGFEAWVNDVEQVLTHIESLYPLVPVILLGHSMGSYVSQMAASKWGARLKGLVLSGTSYELPFLTGLGYLVASLLAFFGGEKASGSLFFKLVFGSFNRCFKPNRTAFDWLSQNTGMVDQYLADPLCGFVPSLGFYKALFSGLKTLYSGSTLQHIPPQLPIAFFSGSKDPLGKQLKAVYPLVKRYKALGHTVDTFFYNNVRHVVLNDLNKDQVWLDLATWISNTLTKEVTP